jgi:hypothetical protein
MRLRKPIAAPTLAVPTALAALAALVAASPSLARQARPVSRPAATGRPPAAPTHTVTTSRQLWATVDVCSPTEEPHTIGIRGSMPGDGHAKDVMYMRFRVQYLDSTTKAWTFVTHGADSGLLKVGPADAVTQAGRSFQFASTKANPAFTLRGVVTFQWRRGAKTIAAAQRTTSAGHHSLAGANPPGFSAATCALS